MASVFYDLQNHMILDAMIRPNDTSERLCAAEHLDCARKDDLLIYDRGYNAFWFYSLHIQRNQSFCIRAKTRRNLAIQAFIESGQREAVVTFEANKPSQNTCQKKGLSNAPIKLRLVRVDLPNEVEVLITNLMDKDRFPAHEFMALYHMRWNIEENYKRLKQWTEIENFSGKSALSVKQDFYAKIVATNLTALMALAAQKIVDTQGRYRQRKYQINFAQALSKMKHHMVSFILRAVNCLSAEIIGMINYMSRTVEAVRPDRSFPRRMKNIKNNIHYPAYKCSL